MDTQEFRTFISAALDRIEAEHGTIPVVAWYHDWYLCERLPGILVVEDDVEYTPPYKPRNSAQGKVLVLCA